METGKAQHSSLEQMCYIRFFIILSKHVQNLQPVFNQAGESPWNNYGIVIFGP